MNPEVTFSGPTSIPITDDFFQDNTPPSPTTTTLITIASCPTVSTGVSQPQASVPLSKPLFIDLIGTTTTTITSSPPVTANVSNTGARASGFSSGTEFAPISPLHRDDPDKVFGDDRDAIEDFHCSPFNVQ